MSPEIFKKWEHLIEEVAKEKIPVEFIKKLVVKLKGRRQKTINVQNLIRNGLEPDEIEDEVSRQLDELDEEMIQIDFVFNIEGIAQVVQSTTDEILQKL
jgi:hypothetical protein